MMDLAEPKKKLLFQEDESTHFKELVLWSALCLPKHSDYVSLTYVASENSFNLFLLESSLNNELIVTVYGPISTQLSKEERQQMLGLPM